MIYAIVAHSALFMQEFFSNRPKIFYVSDEPHVQLISQAVYSIDSFFCIR